MVIPRNLPESKSSTISSKVRVRINANKIYFSFTNVAERRPTKFVFGDPLEEGVLDEPKIASPQPDEERKKSVVFSENVERMQIDSVEEEDDDDYKDVDDDESDHGSNKDETAVTVTATDEDTPDINEKTTEMPSHIFKEIF